MYNVIAPLKIIYENTTLHNVVMIKKLIFLVLKLVCFKYNFYYRIFYEPVYSSDGYVMFHYYYFFFARVRCRLWVYECRWYS